MADTEAVYDTERLWLEPVKRGHAASLFGPLSDPRLHRFIATDPPPSVERLAARYAYLETRRSPDGSELWLNWVMRTKAGGDCIGVVQATLRSDHSAYFAYELGVPWWQRGYATEACGRILQALFDDFGRACIEAEVDTRNQASIALLERLGFERTGCQRDADFFDGATSHEYRYVLLAR